MVIKVDMKVVFSTDFASSEHPEYVEIRGNRIIDTS
jgi:hypothetical protein